MADSELCLPADRDIRALVKGIHKWGDITVRWNEIVSRHDPLESQIRH